MNVYPNEPLEAFAHTQYLIHSLKVVHIQYIVLPKVLHVVLTDPRQEFVIFVFVDQIYEFRENKQRGMLRLSIGPSEGETNQALIEYFILMGTAILSVQEIPNQRHLLLFKLIHVLAEIADYFQRFARRVVLDDGSN